MKIYRFATSTSSELQRDRKDWDLGADTLSVNGALLIYFTSEKQLMYCHVREQKICDRKGKTTAGCCARLAHISPQRGAFVWKSLICNKVGPLRRNARRKHATANIGICQNLDQSNVPLHFTEMFS